jgi:GST-like protein
MRMEDLALHMWATPNSRRVSILFEELGLNFDVRPVNIRANQQFEPEILQLNPFGKVPIAVWTENGSQRTLSESGAILLHFAESDNRFLPSQGSAREETLMWLMIVLTALGPHSSQAHHWSELRSDPCHPALDHYREMVKRVYRLLDERLAENRYFVGDYSVVDIAAYPWIERSDWTTIDISDFPNLNNWRQHISERPAVVRGMSLPSGISLE